MFAVVAAETAFFVQAPGMAIRVLSVHIGTPVPFEVKKYPIVPAAVVAWAVADAP
jgi:hypothetical protein